MSTTELGTEQVQKSRFTLEALEESRGARALLGLVLAAVVVAIIYVILEGFLGDLTTVVKMDATLPLGSNAVVVGAPVEYNFVTVGKIVSEQQARGGAVLAKIDLYPAKMKEVPRNVEAQVQPESIFGNQEVVLEVTPGQLVSATHLAAGDTIGPYSAAASTSLQGSVTTIYNLLHAIQPADLMTALDSLSTALQGQGQALGQSLVAGSNYFGDIEPHLQTVASDIQLLDPVANDLQAATPNVLATLANTTTTAQTITNEASTLHDLLTQGSTTSAQLTSLLTNVETSLPALLNDSGPLLADVARNPNELSQTVSGLGQWAAAWAAAETNGPYITVDANLPIANINDAVDAALGYGLPGSLAGALGADHFNPATYTAADCPTYSGMPNPYCAATASGAIGGSPAADPVGSAGVSAANTDTAASTDSGSAAADPADATGPSTGSTSTTPAAATNRSSPYADATAAAQSIAAALNGGAQPASPAIATMLLLPLLASMSAGSR